jgi:hypothetical protein
VPVGVVRPDSWLVGIAAGEKRAAMMTYALKPEIEEPSHLLVNAWTPR